MRVQILRIAVHIQQPREDLPARLMCRDVVHRRQPVPRVVPHRELAQSQQAAVMLRHFDHLPG